MDSVEAAAVMVEDIPLPGRGAETSVAAVHSQALPADSAAVLTTEVGVTEVAVITVAGAITAQGSDLVSIRPTPMLLAYAVREGSMTSTAFGGPIRVAQFRMAIKA